MLLARDEIEMLRDGPSYEDRNGDQVPRWPSAWPLVVFSARPEFFPGIGVLPGPATESHIVNRGTDPSSQKWDSATLINRQILMDEGPWRGADMMIAWE